ncbi:MAG TPA: TRL domain-containing protein [Desulfuromonadales bacterium]|nr:TRL domain-containing protein [Desulfuromonadales bacterium]
MIRSHQIKEPVTGRSIYAEWSADLILREAQKAGIKEIYYMDKRTLSILVGIYKRESLIVYGD